MTRPHRRATLNRLSCVADETPSTHAKSLELENRIAKLEILVKDLRKAYGEQQRAFDAFRAEIDHVLARLMIR